VGLPVIAVVNNDPDFLDLIQDLIEDSRRYDVRVFQHGMGVADKLRTIDPDVIVLDVRLEYSRLGYHLLESFRRDPRLQAVPVIVCTADTDFLEQYSERLTELGATVLRKPFDLNDLLSLIDGALQEDDQA
jgi:CheY-like chemotaxis protein